MYQLDKTFSEESAFQLAANVLLLTPVDEWTRFTRRAMVESMFNRREKLSIDENSFLTSDRWLRRINSTADAKSASDRFAGLDRLTKEISGSKTKGDWEGVFNEALTEGRTISLRRVPIAHIEDPTATLMEHANNFPRIASIRRFEAQVARKWMM